MPPTQRDPVRGFTLSLLATIFLACNYVTAKYGMGGFNPETLAATWMTAAAVYAFLWALLTGQVRALVITGRPLRWMILLGLANGVCQFTMWQGLQRLDSAFAAFLGRFAPMLAIVMGVFILKERIRPLEWLAIAAMLGGGMLSSARASGAEWLGIVLSLVSAFFSAMQWPLAKIGGRDLPSITMNFYRVAIAAVIVTAWALASGRFDVSHVRWDHWAVTLLGSFIGPFLSYVLMFRSYDYWDMSRSAIVWTLQPLVVIPMAMAVFGEFPSRTKLIGGLVTLGGAFALAYMHRKTQPAPIED